METHAGVKCEDVHHEARALPAPALHPCLERRRVWHVTTHGAPPCCPPATRTEQKVGGVEGAEGALLTSGGCCCANDSLALK